MRVAVNIEQTLLLAYPGVYFLPVVRLFTWRLPPSIWSRAMCYAAFWPKPESVVCGR